jgi:peptide/nickel transport system substrate-binding protein
MLQRLIAAVLVSMLLASGSSASTPKDTLVMAKGIDDVTTFDPAEGYNLGEMEVISNLYDRLIRWDPKDLKTKVGGVAESWKADDATKTVTFKLRSGLKFQSGNALTADDVAFSMRRMIVLKKFPSTYLAQFGLTPENFDTLVKVVDPSTISITCPKNYSLPLLLSALTSVAGAVVDKAEVLKHVANDDFGNAWLKSHSAGSGAYALKAWRANDAIELTAYPGYRLGKPHMQRIIIKHVPEAASQRLLLEKGDVDIARELTADQVKALADRKDIKVEAFPQLTNWFLGLNQSDARLKNPKVREAFHYLIDYQGMVQSFLKGQATVSQTFWPDGLPDSLNRNPYTLDIAKAKQLLAEAGYPNGFEVQMHVFNASPFTDIAQSIQSTAAQAGIKINLVQGDQKQIFGVYRSRGHQLIFIRSVPDYAEISAAADLFAWNPDNSDNALAKPNAWRNNWIDPDITHLVDVARTEPDPEKRAQEFVTIQDRVQREGPYAFAFRPSLEVAMRSNVNGFKIGLLNDILYYHLISK